MKRRKGHIAALGLVALVAGCAEMDSLFVTESAAQNAATLNQSMHTAVYLADVCAPYGVVLTESPGMMTMRNAAALRAGGLNPAEVAMDLDSYYTGPISETAARVAAAHGGSTVQGRDKLCASARQQAVSGGVMGGFLTLVKR